MFRIVGPGSLRLGSSQTRLLCCVGQVHQLVGSSFCGSSDESHLAVAERCPPSIAAHVDRSVLWQHICTRLSFGRQWRRDMLPVDAIVDI